MSAATKKTRAEQKEETRARILEAALRLFATHGISRTSTRRIAKEAGVSEGLIFHHFPKKSDLLLGIKGTRQTMAGAVVQLMAQAGEMPVTTVIPLIAARFVNILGAKTVEARLFQILIGESRINPELGALFDATSGEVVGAIAGYLRARIAAGELREELGCEAAAQTLLGSFMWFFISNRFEDEEAWTAAATTYTQQVVDHWLQGALRR